MPLTPSQRIKLIKVIVEKLDLEVYSIADMTLRQFGFDCQDFWEGSKLNYLIQMAEPGSDDSLVALSTHLGQSEATQVPVADTAPPFWQTGMLRTFISHLSSQKGYAADLKKSLKYYGIAGFVAHNDIEPTLAWQDEIEVALGTCHSLVALLHVGFHISNWTDQEIGYAMGRKIPVFAVRLGCDPYGFVGRFQAFNGNQKSTDILAKELFDAYRKNTATKQVMSEAVVTSFVNCETYASARERISYLENIEILEPIHIARLKTALKANSQIYDAIGVPDRLKALIKKWGEA